MDNHDLGFRFSSGGEAELEEVIELYGAKLFQYCLNTVCNYHAAEDITQQVLIKAYRKRDSFRGDSSLSTWLYRIAYNTCMDHLRLSRFFLPLYEVTETFSEMDNSDDGFSQEVLNALLRLSPKERAVIYGRIVEKKSYSELAEISNVSEATLRKRYMRAKRKLAGFLQSTDLPEGRIKNETI